MSVKIEWVIDVSPSIHSIIKDINSVDNAINNELVNDSMWNQVFKKISTFIQKRFEEGKSSWKPLSPKYVKWKVSAARRGVQIPVGSFGRRVCKLTAIGRLTDTMFPSATEKRFANIFEVNKIANGAQFRYAIDGNKLPYAVYFNKVRPFFYITNEEAEQVFKVITDKIANKLNVIWK